ncbi:MAG: hypothetical protein Q8P50_09385 [Bacillota bacterium]|jgi:hypothetical protein|nr:hypothetical protein [Bacillota bacterium]
MTLKVLGTWVAAIGTLAVYSYLYKENALFRAVEYILVGLTTAHLTVMGYQNVFDVAIKPVMTGTKTLMIVPIILGLLLYTRWFKQYSWVSRIPVSFMLAVAAAVTITGNIDANFMRQVRATMVPIKNFDGLVVLVGTVGTLMYFFFMTIPGGSRAKGNAGILARVLAGGAELGRWVMMVAFGASFGAAVMSRIGLFIGRLQFLFGDWLHLIK